MCKVKILTNFVEYKVKILISVILYLEMVICLWFIKIIQCM